MLAKGCLGIGVNEGVDDGFSGGFISNVNDGGFVVLLLATEDDEPKKKGGFGAVAVSAAKGLVSAPLC